MGGHSDDKLVHQMASGRQSAQDATAATTWKPDRRITEHDLPATLTSSPLPDPRADASAEAEDGRMAGLELPDGAGDGAEDAAGGGGGGGGAFFAFARPPAPTRPPRRRGRSVGRIGIAGQRRATLEA